FFRDGKWIEEIPEKKATRKKKAAKKKAKGKKAAAKKKAGAKKAAAKGANRKPAVSSARRRDTTASESEAGGQTQAGGR
ncbi:hypothetical protein MK280_19720, partial [Myxococcota bacterium]|nr:hypothetical protein [Myxococcota bacterium]